MPGSGIRSGVTRAAWRSYTPLLHGTNVSGTPTMPSLGNGLLQGRYLDHPSGLVIAQAILVMGSTTTLGDGDALIMGLPKPANRWTANLGSSTADLPIGSALAWQGDAASPSWPTAMIPTLADPLAGYNLQTNEDYYAHFFVPQWVSQGSGAVISGTNTNTGAINHSLAGTPVASDFNVVCTAKSGSPTAPRQVYIDSITSTQFTINVAVAPGVGNSLTFGWKARAEPNNTSLNLPQLLSYRKPWTWATNHMLSAQFVYEPR